MTSTPPTIARAELISRWLTEDGRRRRESVLARMRAHEDWASLLCDFPGAAEIPHFEDLRGIDLRNEVLTSLALDFVQLAYSKLDGCHLERAHMQNVVLSEASLADARLSGVMMTGAVAAGACFDRADLSDAHLNACDLTGASFRAAKLVRTNLSWSKLAGADLQGADMTGADRHAATLPEALGPGAEFFAPGESPVRRGPTQPSMGAVAGTESRSPLAAAARVAERTSIPREPSPKSTEPLVRREGGPTPSPTLLVLREQPALRPAPLPDRSAPPMRHWLPRLSSVALVLNVAVLLGMIFTRLYTSPRDASTPETSLPTTAPAPIPGNNVATLPTRALVPPTAPLPCSFAWRTASMSHPTCGPSVVEVEIVLSGAEQCAPGERLYLVIEDTQSRFLPLGRLEGKDGPVAERISVHHLKKSMWSTASIVAAGHASMALYDGDSPAQPIPGKLLTDQRILASLELKKGRACDSNSASAGASPPATTAPVPSNVTTPEVLDSGVVAAKPPEEVEEDRAFVELMEGTLDDQRELHSRWARTMPPSSASRADGGP